jgi:WD40 repeat protein/serine/threonine protein kinase
VPAAGIGAGGLLIRVRAATAISARIVSSRRNQAMHECPDRETLERFLAGALPGRDEDDLCAHIEACPACQRELDGLVAALWPGPRAAEGAGPRGQDFDLAFLRRLQQTFTDPDWRPPPWTDPGPHPSRSAGPDGPPLCVSPGSVPGYEILGELGRGSMGVVYRARQLGLGRLTALKMILAGEHAGLNDRARFRAEAEAAGSLRHPHIVQVHEIGEAGGLLYFSMEYVEGETLKQWLHGAPRPARAAALLMELLARAVAFAHRHGIVHRDLKPANVLLEAPEARPASTEPAGPVVAAAELARLGLVPKITDFGLAKRLGDTLGTRTGELMGTPGYMSPEQLAGRAGASGPGVDIYALGCILYEALTGRPPFLDASLEALADRVRREEPIPPRRLQPRCPRDLETICLKCLEKEPARRYRGASDLADDLARFLAGEPILARAPSTLDRGIRFARRHRALVAGASAVMATLALGIAATGVMAVRESTARQRADVNADRATESARQAEVARAASQREAYQARLAAATAAMGTHDIREASRQLELAPEVLRGWEWRHLRGQLDQSLSVVAGMPSKAHVDFCPPGRRLAVSAGRSGYRLLDAATGGCLAARATDAPCRQVFAFRTSAGPRFVLDQSGESLAFSITDEDGVALGRIAPPQPDTGPATSPFAMAMSPDGRRLAFQVSPYNRSPLVEVFDTATGRRTARFGGVWASLRALDFSPDGTQVAAVHETSKVYLFDLRPGEPERSLAGHSGGLRGVAYSRDGKRLASCGDDQTIRVWDTGTWKTLQTLRGHVGGVLCVGFRPDGRRLVSGGSDSTLRIWDVDHGHALLVRHGHTAGVIHVAFDDEGRTIASTAEDGTARLWDAMAADDASVLRGHASYVYPVAFSPDGRRIASGSWDRTIRLWDAASGRPARTLSGHAGPPGALAFTPDGARLASWADDATIRLWDTATGEEIGPRLIHQSMYQRDSVYSLVVSPDGRRIGAATAGGVRFWDAATRAELPPLRLPIAGVRVVAFSPDGRRIAAGGDAAKVIIVDAASGELIAELSGFEGRIQSVAFSPDGRHVLTAGKDPTLRLWDAATGELVRTFAGHGLEVLSAVFHPDGTRIASGGHDRSIRIWDAATGEELVRLPGHTWYVFSLAFSPDGETLVSGSGDSTVRLWDTFPLARRLRAR